MRLNVSSVASRLSHCTSHRARRNADHINKKARQAGQKECIAVAVLVLVCQALDVVKLELKALRTKQAAGDHLALLVPEAAGPRDERHLCVEKCSPAIERITPAIP